MVEHGAVVIVPIEDRPHGRCESRLRDPFGHLWILSHVTEQLSDDEIRSRMRGVAGGRAARDAGARAPVRPMATIEVDDVEGVHDRLVERGYPVVHPLTTESWGVRRFFVEDPNGNVINVLSHVS
jgi:uncharacterized glyoxalase superfamily protein PhnB